MAPQLTTFTTGQLLHKVLLRVRAMSQMQSQAIRNKSTWLLIWRYPAIGCLNLQNAFTHRACAVYSAKIEDSATEVNGVRLPSLEVIEMMQFKSIFFVHHVYRYAVHHSREHNLQASVVQLWQLVLGVRHAMSASCKFHHGATFCGYNMRWFQVE